MAEEEAVALVRRVWPDSRLCSKIATGSHVLFEGELAYRQCERSIETESGPLILQWPRAEDKPSVRLPANEWPDYRYEHEEFNQCASFVS
jgi:hypothetical protein